MPEAVEWTIGKLLEWTKVYLSEHGSDSPRLDAEVLLAHAQHCQRIELYTAFDEVASDTLRDAFRALVKRRATGIPVAYLVESREFYSLAFHVNQAVLIPRPETEFLVIRLLDLAKEQQKDDFRILDVGTGSGVLAICAAIYLPNSQIVAIDISEDALKVARQNAATHQVADRIDFRQGDLLSDLADDDRFDFIVSNPPYVSEPEFEQLDCQVRNHEPKLALVAGPQGTEVIEHLVPQAADHLVDGGWLLMEISPMIRSSVQDIVGRHDDFDASHVTNDLAKLARIVAAQRKTPSAA
jgi:release factor glutamine methyltransferase